MPGSTLLARRVLMEHLHPELFHSASNQLVSASYTAECFLPLLISTTASQPDITLFRKRGLHNKVFEFTLFPLFLLTFH